MRALAKGEVLEARSFRRGRLRPEGSAGILKLRLARREGGALIYAGRVGTGWDHKTAHAIRCALEPLARSMSPLTATVKKRIQSGLSRASTPRLANWNVSMEDWF